MRMWMVNPRIMCRRHLLGEHVEIHMLAGSITKGRSIQGFLRKGLVAPQCMLTRHAALVHEMQRRGMHHKSPLRLLQNFHLPHGHVDHVKSEKELLRRCAMCRLRAAQSTIKGERVET